MELDANSDLVNLLTAYKSAGGMHKVLKEHRPRLHTDTLHEALHKLIENDVLNVAKALATIIQSLAVKEPKRQQNWDELLACEDISVYLKKHHGDQFTWEKYFEHDMKARKKKNFEQRNKSIMRLYKNKTISIFAAIPHLKLFFTLLKLGADPFEIRDSKSLTYAIVKSKLLTKTKRLHILTYMADNKLLTLDPCGKKNVSPIILALKMTRKHTLPFLVRAPGIDKVELAGKNIIHETIENTPGSFKKIIPHFTVEQLKKLLLETHRGSSALYRLKNISLGSDLYKFNTAVKELLQTERIIPKLLDGLFPWEFVVENYPSYKGAECQIARNSTQKIFPFMDTLNSQMTNFGNGNTEFHFEFLPLEIAELICVWLTVQERAKFFATSKPMKTMHESFSNYSWKQMLRNDAPLLFQKLEADPTTLWHENTMKYIRSNSNWRSGRYKEKIIPVESYSSPPSMLALNEHWLAMTNEQKLRFWNCSDDTQHVIDLQPEFLPYQLHYLTSEPNHVPSFVMAGYKKFAVSTNSETRYYGFEEHQLSDHTFLAPLSAKKILIGPSGSVFDIERSKVILRNKLGNALAAKRNPFNRSLLVHTSNKIILYDDSLNKVLDIDAKAEYNYASIDFVDEHVIMASNVHASSFIDLRTLKPLWTHPTNSLTLNHAGRAVHIDHVKRLAIVWNLKTFKWECTWPLPDFTLYPPRCNSRYIIFANRNPYNSLLALDFDGI